MDWNSSIYVLYSVIGVGFFLVFFAFFGLFTKINCCLWLYRISQIFLLLIFVILGIVTAVIVHVYVAKMEDSSCKGEN